MKLSLSLKQLRVLEPLRLDEEKDQKTVFGKVRIWKNVLKNSRKFASAAMALIFLTQLTLAGPARAELPPPTAEQLTNPQTPTVTLEQSLQETTVDPVTTEDISVTTDDFLTAGPLSPATLTTTSLVSEPLVVTAAAVTTPGRSLYVSTTGSDASEGSQTNPYGTIAYAVSQLQAGDTLSINEGTYYQPGGGAVFNASGTADANITIKGLGNVVIQGTATTMISGYPVASNYNPAFDTKGYDYIRFENLTVNNLRAAVTVSPNSSYVVIDGLKADRNHFAVLINGGDHITVRNVVATNSRNGFRTEATTGVLPTDILFENIDVSGSRDVYSGFESRYRNGDGFILEFGNRIMVRNVKSYDNWDGGFDVKATNVTMDGVEAYGNKNNFKVWGTGLVVKNSLSHDAKVFVGDPVAGEGYGVNNRMGYATFINTTFANNETADIRIDNDGGASTTILQNCIIVRNRASGALYVRDGGSMTESDNVWYDPMKAADFILSGSSRWVDPKVVSLAGKDFHLQNGSPAIDIGATSYAITELDYDGNARVVGDNIDVGAYEYQGSAIPDTTAPVISVVTSSNVAANGATINWTTNEASDSQVQYRVQGTTTWLSTVLNTTLVTNHSVVLSGLNTSTVYEYQVLSKDKAGNLATQATISAFTTAMPDTTAPVISAVASVGVTSTAATINWTTNEISDSQVEYRVQGTTTWSASSINSTLVTNHSIVLSGLTASTVYQFRVKSKDQVGNLATQETISTLTTANPASTADFVGVTAGATVSGVVNIGPNLAIYPTVRKVSYYLNGTQSGKVYASPYLWGGLTGNGTTGVDTRTLADGNYTLNMGYTDAAGDHSASVSFMVQNTIIPPTDTTAPAISAVVSSDVTETGATVSWKTNEASDSQVQYRAQGTTTWLNTVLNTTLATSHSVVLTGLNARTVYEYQVKSKDQAGNLATQATISTLTTLTPTTACTTAMCGVTVGQVVSGMVKIQPNLTLEPSIRKVAYYLNGTQSGKEYTSPFTWGGTAGYDTTKLADGTYTLAGAYTTATGDKSFSITFTVKNSGVPTADTVAPVISAVVSSNITSTGATINWTTNEASDSQVEYRVQGTTTWSATPINASLVASHSVTLSGLTAGTVYEYRVKSKDAAGNLATQATISNLTTANTLPVTGDFVGVTEGAVVSGVVNIGPNLTLYPTIRKVAYYLNGTQSGKYYEVPYTWGGAQGFDTRKLENGTYTLIMGYTDSTGDHSLSVTFTVSN